MQGNENGEVKAASSLVEAVSMADALYAPYINTKIDPYHRVLEEFVQRCNRLEECKLLEIGSREVSGNSRKQLFGNSCKYHGFDIHAGPGVDVVGDAHELSHHFPLGELDAVFSISVFEHLAFPWKVVMEINRVLRVGGLCYVSTHPTWPPHELPWDFWRFPVAGLRLLFSGPLGFRLLTAVEGLPAKLHSLVPDPPTRAVSGFQMSMGVALIAEKTHDYDNERLRWDVSIGEVLESIYPNRTTAALVQAPTIKEM